MSALAQMIESRGIATVVVGLVRPHMEKSRVPRGLWVPFPLGRPFGEPEDKAFQRRVVTSALALLERRDGPHLIVDFPDDAPSIVNRRANETRDRRAILTRGGARLSYANQRRFNALPPAALLS